MNSWNAGPDEMSYDLRDDGPDDTTCRDCGDGTGALCDPCWLIESRRRELNDAIYVQAVQKWFRKTDPVQA